MLSVEGDCCGVTAATLVTSPETRGHVARTRHVLRVECVYRECGSCILCSVTGSGVEDHCGTHLYYQHTCIVPPPGPRPSLLHLHYSVSGLSCPEEEAYLTVIFHSYLHNNNINSDYILGANIYFTPHGNFS